MQIDRDLSRPFTGSKKIYIFRTAIFFSPRADAGNSVKQSTEICSL